MRNFNNLRARLRWTVALSLIALPVVIQSEELLIPDMGNTADYGVSPAEEKKTGEAVIRNIRRGGGVVDDPLIEDYLDHLGFRLISNTNHAEQHFKFFLINDKILNAFALPGGFIGINYGLILATESESELASVMAHEVAHITQRHHARTFEAGSNQGPILAALIAAMILGAGNSEISQAAFAASAAGMMQSQINFTRANEKEADHMGINMLANAGYDPMAMATFFGRLEKESGLYGSQVPEFLRSHPVSTNRMTDATNRARGLKPKKKQYDKQSFYLIRARIRALAHEDTHKAVAEFSKRLESGRYQNRDAELYGYAWHYLGISNTARPNRFWINYWPGIQPALPIWLPKDRSKAQPKNLHNPSPHIRQHWNCILKIKSLFTITFKAC